MPLLPVRGVDGDRKRVSPKPRSDGTIVRKPAARSDAATASQLERSSGQPCSSRTTGASRGPSSR